MQDTATIETTDRSKEPKQLRDHDMIGGVEIPKYKSYKVVRALRIRHIEAIGDGGTRKITFRDPAFKDISVTLGPEVFARYVPLQGDYYVVYDDGYKSFSPYKNFVDGYMPFDPLYGSAEPKMPPIIEDAAELSEVIERGDTVILHNCDGPTMKVLKIEDGSTTTASVVWFDANLTLQRTYFPVSFLRAIKK